MYLNWIWDNHLNQLKWVNTMDHLKSTCFTFKCNKSWIRVGPPARLVVPHPRTRCECFIWRWTNTTPSSFCKKIFWNFYVFLLLDCVFSSNTFKACYNQKLGDQLILKSRCPISVVIKIKELCFHSTGPEFEGWHSSYWRQ